MRTEFTWPEHIDADLERAIVQLMRETTASDPIIGFGQAITDVEAAHYIAELRGSLRAGKCRLLVVRRDGDVIALCTLRRNLNPNNAHIVDLAKGMIAHRYRGTAVLSASLYEIGCQCERDGAELITLDVRAQTPAHRVWERFGFEIYGTLRDYARVNGESRAGHFMMQTVSDLKARAAAACRLKPEATLE
ncbi:MAG: GNAT family N-acetyltransferase [Gammaproteobacteria bacterium]